MVLDLFIYYSKVVNSSSLQVTCTYTSCVHMKMILILDIFLVYFIGIHSSGSWGAEREGERERSKRVQTKRMDRGERECELNEGGGVHCICMHQ